jgi:S-sulfosulfanyl-L-cysteine sulfohydrolase
MATDFTIIQQNDTHGCLDMHKELFWQSNGPFLKNAGGFSRISKYVKELRKQKSNVLFLDGGDLFHGQLPLVSSKGNAILPILNKMELDAFVPGNWDFAYGKEQLIHLAESLPFPVVACNLIDEETGKPFLKPYFIREMQGVKVGVIGLTYPYVDKTMPDSFSEGLLFSKGTEEISRIIEVLKEETDLIILMSHMGLPLDVKLASLVNGIDIILSGHSHDRVTKPMVIGQTIVVQAGSNSSFLGRLDVTLEGGNVTNINYQLVNITEDFEEDEEIQELVEMVMDPFADERNTVAGETHTLLHRMTLNESPMDRLITNAYLHSYECDLSFSHGWRYGPPLQEGALSMYDLYSIIPTNPKMFTLEMDGQTLWNSLEHNLEQVFSADPFEQKGGYILRSSGLFMTFKPYNPKGHRIQSLLVGEREIDFHKTYKIVGGGSQLFKAQESLKMYDDNQAIDLIRAYLKDNGPFQEGGREKIISV